MSDFDWEAGPLEVHNWGVVTAVGRYENNALYGSTKIFDADDNYITSVWTNTGRGYSDTDRLYNRDTFVKHVEVVTDESLAKQYRELDAQLFKIHKELKERGYKIEDANEYSIVFSIASRIYKTETITKEL